MSPLDLGVLVLDDGQDVRRKVLLEHSFIIFECRIFTAFTLRNDGFGAAAGHDGLDVHPASVECRGDAAAFFRGSAELPHFRLELRSELRSLKRTLVEEPAEL